MERMMTKTPDVPEPSAAELLDIRNARDPLPALRHTVKMFGTEYTDKHAIVATKDYYGPGITTGLTWGHLRALLSELEMYRQQEQQS
jgi:hypothetical protein